MHPLPDSINSATAFLESSLKSEKLFVFHVPKKISVSLDWSDYNYEDKNFKVYKSDDGGSTYETIGID